MLTLRIRFLWEEGRVNLMNLLDVVIISTCSVDLYYFTDDDDNTQGDLASVRFLRLLRLTRALRVVRVMSAFTQLRILMKTTAASFVSLFWAMILMFLFVYGSAVFLCQVLQGPMRDTTIPLDLRMWIFRYYGSGSRSFWTLFEITFSGGWPNYARRLIEELHWGYALFFAVYVWVVIFAVTRVITALFLKDTMQVASEDSDSMLREHRARKEKSARKLQQLFSLIDETGDGAISLEEFKQMAHIPEVQMHFAALDLQIEEVCDLFSMLDAGNGQVNYDEFCAGIMRLKGQARSLDVVSTMRDCRVILRKCVDLERRVEAIADAFGLGSPAPSVRPNNESVSEEGVETAPAPPPNCAFVEWGHVQSI